MSKRIEKESTDWKGESGKNPLFYFRILPAVLENTDETVYFRQETHIAEEPEKRPFLTTNAVYTSENLLAATANFEMPDSPKLWHNIHRTPPEVLKRTHTAIYRHTVVFSAMR